MSAAAVVVIKEKELMAHFRERGALSPAAALSTNALGVAENDTFRRLCAHAVIREAAPGVFYLDETAARARQYRMRRVALTLIVVAAVLAIVMLVAAPGGSQS
jgi:hypothetical protein